jgi:hypothetical protein
MLRQLASHLPAYVAPWRDCVGAKAKLNHRALAGGFTGDFSSEAAFYGAFGRAQREQGYFASKWVPNPSLLFQVSGTPSLRMLVTVELKPIAIELAVSNFEVTHGLTPIIGTAIRVTLCQLAICTENGGRPVPFLFLCPISSIRNGGRSLTPFVGTAVRLTLRQSTALHTDYTLTHENYTQVHTNTCK